MPIRMEKDPNESRRRPQPQEPGQSKGGFPKGLGLIALLLYLFKKPKWALLVLAIAVAIWFFSGSGSGFMADTGGGEDPFSMGALLSEEKYDQAEVYEPLATSYGAIVDMACLLVLLCCRMLPSDSTRDVRDLVWDGPVPMQPEPFCIPGPQEPIPIRFLLVPLSFITRSPFRDARAHTWLKPLKPCSKEELCPSQNLAMTNAHAETNRVP